MLATFLPRFCSDDGAGDLDLERDLSRCRCVLEPALLDGPEDEEDEEPES